MTKLRESNFRLLTAWNLVSYTCVALSFGLITGIGFGHYQIQRYQLLQFRHDDIQDKITELENQLVRVNAVFKVNIANSKILKKRSFSIGCSEEKPLPDKKVEMDVYEFYDKKPQFYRAISGLTANLDDADTQGRYHNKITNQMKIDVTKNDAFIDKYDDSTKTKWTVKLTDGEPGDFSKCYIAVPGLDFK